jgi:hypothetical protein
VLEKCLKKKENKRVLRFEGKEKKNGLAIKLIVEV